MIDLWREICKPVLKLDFSAHGIMESLSEFELGLGDLRFCHRQLFFAIAYTSSDMVCRG
jgi:hypothetical protein